VLDILASGCGSKLAEFTPDDLMQSGNGELVNWVITAGICGDVKCQVLDYIRPSRFFFAAGSCNAPLSRAARRKPTLVHCFGAG
jgi:hypothetical protein